VYFEFSDLLGAIKEVDVRQKLEKRNRCNYLMEYIGEICIDIKLFEVYHKKGL
jgi:hypothetical protein